MPNLLYFYINTSPHISAVTSMVVLRSSLISGLSGILLRYFLNDYGMVPVAPVITGITFVFTLCMRCISLVSSFYFGIFSASFLITFLSPEIATSINTYTRFSLSRIIMSGLFLGMVLSLCTFWFHNMVTFPSCLVSANFGACLYQFSLPNCTHYFLACVKLVKHTPSCSFASIGHADIMWSFVSPNC